MSPKLVVEVLFRIQLVVDAALLDKGDEESIPFAGQRITVQFLALLIVFRGIRDGGIVERVADGDTAEDIRGEASPALELVQPECCLLADAESVKTAAAAHDSASCQKYPGEMEVCRSFLL